MRSFVPASSLLALLVSACLPAVEISKPNEGEVDVTPPTVTITSPTQTTFALGEAITFAGSVSDDQAIAGVELRVGTNGSVLSAAIAASSWSVSVPTTSLSAGSYTVEVIATDTGNNTASAQLAIELIAPPVAMLANLPDALTSSRAIAVNVSGAGVTKYRATLDGTELGEQPIATPITANDLTDGMHTLSVLGGDAIFQTTPTTHAWTIDATPPLVSLSGLPPALDNDPTPMIALASTTDIVSYAWSLSCNSAVVASAADVDPSTALAIPALSDGTCELTVTARDAAGNETTEQHAWVLDATPPDTLLASAPNGTIVETTFDITVSGSGATTYAYSLDCAGTANDVSNGSAPIATHITPTSAPVADGACSLTVAARDSAGNVDATPATANWTIDSSLPNTVLSGLPSDPTNTTNLDVTVSGTNGANAYAYSLDCAGTGSDVSNADVPAIATHITASGLPEGTCTLTVIARSPLQSDPTPATFTWSIDVSPPDTTLSGLPAPTGNVATLDVTVSNGEASGSYDYVLDCDDDAVDANTSVPSLSTHITAAVIGDGACTLQVTARDALGNPDGSPATYAWIIDTVAPDTTTLTGAPVGVTGATNVSITVAGSGAPTTYVYSLSCGATTLANNVQQPMGASISHMALPDALCSLTVAARDEAGNVDASPLTASWTVDTTPPDTGPLGGLPSDPTAITALDVTVSGSDSPTHYRYSVVCNATPVETNVEHALADKITTAVPEGSCALTVATRDEAGNVDPTPVQQTFTVDRTGPTITLSGGPSGLTGATSFSIAVSTLAADAANYRYSLNGGPQSAAQPFATPITLTDLSDGDYTLQVIGRDTLGNAGPAQSLSFSVDARPPVVRCPSAPLDASTPITITFDQPVTPGATIVSGDLAAFAGFDSNDTILILSPNPGPAWNVSAPTLNVRVLVHVESAGGATDAVCNYDRVGASTLHYVADHAGAVEDGSQANPWKTIGAALTAANGTGGTDIIFVREGDYTLPTGASVSLVSDVLVYGGYSTSDWNVRSAGASRLIASTTLSFEGVFDFPIGTVLCEGATQSVFDGFTVLAPQKTPVAAADKQTSIRVTGVCSTIFRDNTLQPSQIAAPGFIYGVFVEDSGAAPVFERNHVRNTSSTNAQGIRVSGGSAELRGNDILLEGGTERTGIYFATSSPSTVADNVISIRNTTGATRGFEADTTPTGLWLERDAFRLVNTPYAVAVQNSGDPIGARGVTVDIAAAGDLTGLTGISGLTGSTIHIVSSDGNAEGASANGIVEGNVIDVSGATIGTAVREITEITRFANNRVSAFGDCLAAYNAAPRNSATFEIVGNTLTCSNVGINAELDFTPNPGASVTIADNTISAAVGTTDSYDALYVHIAQPGPPTASVTVERNRLFSSSGPGLILASSGAATIRNNVIVSGGDGITVSNGFNFTNDPIAAAVLHNTVYTGGSGLSFGNLSTSAVRNNLFVGRGSGTAIVGGGAEGPIANNGVAGFAAAYHNLLSVDCSSPCADITALMGSFSGNVNVNPMVLFADIDGADDDLATWGEGAGANDFSLQAGSQCEVREGGLDLTATVSTDFANAVRTAVTSCTPSNAGASGVSIGAYEQDP